MSDFQRLMQTAQAKNCRLMIRFDPEEFREEWGVKFYPHEDDDAHFYAYNSDLNAASRQLLNELQGFTSW